MSHGSAERRARRQARWQAAAQERGLASILLWPVSLVYRGLIALRRALFKAGVFPIRRLSVPVIVVGNVVVGGAGKTPTVIALVRHLQAAGWQPGVISRGYGRVDDATVQVESDTDPITGGDEPVLIHRATGAPVCVARARVDAAQALLAAHPDTDVLLCDDGLQHHALGRDISIAVFDERGIGNGWLLPAGLLREPWPPKPGVLNAPDLVLHHVRKGHQQCEIPVPARMPRFDATRRLADHVLNHRGERIPLESLTGRPLTAIAGIARPVAFFDMLRGHGLQVQREVPMPDHAAPADYDEWLRDTTATLVCTEKDAMKIFARQTARASIAAPQVWAIPLELTPDPAFFEAIDARLEQWKRLHDGSSD